MARRRGKLRTFKHTRSALYKGARVMGNVQPWLELDLRKVVRRWVYRKVGKRIVAPFFGGRGPAGKIIKQVLGIR